MGREDPGSSRVVCTASFSEDTLKKEKQAAYTDTYLVSEANGKSKSDRCPLWPFRLSLICLPRPQSVVLTSSIIRARRMLEMQSPGP